MDKTEAHGSHSKSSGLIQMDQGDLLDWTVRILVIATEIVTMEDPQEISRRVVDALALELGLPMVSIILADDAGKLKYTADHGVSDEVKALGFREGGTAYTAYNTAQASFVEDILSDPRANPKTRNLLGAYASLPIHHRGRSYGVIMVTFSGSHAFPPIERVILTAFAHQMGIALDNGRLHRAEQRRIAFLAAQADLSEALSSTLKRKDVVRILGETLQNTATSYGVVLWMEHERMLELGFHAGVPEGEALRQDLPLAASRVMVALGGDALAQVPLDALWEDLGVDPAPEAGARAFAMPLLCATGLEGLLVFLVGPEAFDPDLVRAMGDRASMALHNARLYEDSQAAASIDPLTGLYNRRAFLGSARTLVDGARRNGAPLSLIMLDADNFKVCNDTYGHPVGDKVLVLLARILRAHIRPADLVGRLGGEEFAVALQCASEETAFRVAERIRKAMADSRLDLEEGTIAVPTVSLGLAEMDGEGGLDRLVERADAALYLAKDGGRNRTCRSSGLT